MYYDDDDEMANEDEAPQQTQHRFNTKLEAFVNDDKWQQCSRDDRSIARTICNVFGENIVRVMDDVNAGPNRPTIPFFASAGRDTVCLHIILRVFVFCWCLFRFASMFFTYTIAFS